jgi:hypothetical protein
MIEHVKSSMTERDLQFLRRVVLWAKRNHGATYHPKVLQGQGYFCQTFSVTNGTGSLSLSAKTQFTLDTL